jgi:hypothetical protein
MIGEGALGYCNSLEKVVFEGNAPVFGINAFEGTATIAYYPQGDSTWRAAVLQNYGGLVNWMPYGDGEEPEYIDLGECGNNVGWKLTVDGILTIFGQGDMYDYGEYDEAAGEYYFYYLPYEDYLANIRRVFIEPGVTSIGVAAFYGCYMTDITIADTVTDIDDYAFYYCENLTDVTIPDSVSRIGEGAFYLCTGLQEIEIPDSVTFIGDYAFVDCIICVL